MNTTTVEREPLAIQQYRAGALIAELEQRVGLIDRPALIKLVGADITRDKDLSALRFFGQAYASQDIDQILIFLEDASNRISKLEAKRVFTLFPRAITPKAVWPYGSEELEHFAEFHAHYTGAGLWLINWEKGGRFTNFLNDVGLQDSLYPAMVSRDRYVICDYLKAKSNNIFFKTYSSPLLWLLTEISACRRRLDDLPKETSKRSHQNRMADVAKLLDSQVRDPSANTKKLPEIETESLPEILEKFEGVFLYEAHRLAKIDAWFDEYKWSPYLKAEGAWRKQAARRKGKTAYLS